VEGSPGYYRFIRNGQAVQLQPLGKGDATSVDDPSTLILLGRITGMYRRLEHLPVSVTAVAH
jgi:hypothetical protein